MDSNPTQFWHRCILSVKNPASTHTHDVKMGVPRTWFWIWRQWDYLVGAAWSSGQREGGTAARPFGDPLVTAKGTKTRFLFMGNALWWHTDSKHEICLHLLEKTPMKKLTSPRWTQDPMGTFGNSSVIFGWYKSKIKEMPFSAKHPLRLCTPVVRGVGSAKEVGWLLHPSLTKKLH